MGPWFLTPILLWIYRPSKKKTVSTRVSDASLALTQLGQPSVVKLVPGARCAFDVSKAAMYGHSLGGVTAIAAVEKDCRL